MKLITLKEAAKIYKYEKSYLRRLCVKRWFPCEYPIKVGSTWMILVKGEKAEMEELYNKIMSITGGS